MSGPPQLSPDWDGVVAVIAGDIIKSSRLSADELSDVRVRIQHAFERFRRIYSQADCKGIGFFRGDGWQAVLGNPGYALRLSAFIQSELMQGDAGIRTRMALGVGCVDEIDLQDVGNSTGAAFALAGHALDDMNLRSPDIVVSMQEGFEAVSAYWGAFGRVLSSTMRHWTSRQAEIAHAALCAPGLSHEALSEKLSLPVSRTTVTDSLNASRFDIVTIILDVCEGKAPE